MGILQLIRQKLERVLGRSVLVDSRGERPADSARLCLYGHTVFSGNNLCNYGHHAA